MKATKNLMSALLGAALLAMPITAAARSHDGGHNRGPAPAYHQMPAFRPAVAPRVNVAPRSPIVQVHDRDDWRWRDRDDGWKHRDRDDWRWRDHDRDDAWRDRRGNYPYRTLCDEDGDDCRQVPRYNNNLYYRQGYQLDSYNYGPPYYGAPVGGGVANLIYQRNNAQILYQQAVQNGNRVRAKHLRNDILSLNKRIGGAGGGYSGYGAFNSPYAGNYGNGYGAPNDGFSSMFTPLFGNYIH
jgi:hypothetical protein